MAASSCESLESRTLLAAAFSNADVTGNYWFVGTNVKTVGSISFNGAGKIGVGSVKDTAGRTLKITGGTYSVLPDGTISGSASTSNSSDPTIRFSGAISSNKQSLVLSDLDQLGKSNSNFVLIKRSTGLTTKDVAGTWSLPGVGSVTFSSAGKVTGGQIILTEGSSSITATVVSGSGTLAATGTGTGTMKISVPGVGQFSFGFAVVVSSAKDILAVVLTTPTSNFSGSLVFAKPGSGMSAANLVGSWTLGGDTIRGTVNFDGAGHLKGAGTDDASGSGTLSGTYSVGADGAVTLKVTSSASSGTSKYTVSGRMNASKNFVLMKVQGADVPEMFLIRPDGAFATLSRGKLSVKGTSAADAGSLTVKSGKLSVKQNGVTQTFTASSIKSINISLGDGNDTISLGSGVIGATIDGGAGDDTITGGSGNDSLLGGSGKDSITAGAGNDTIVGGSHADRLFGGTGNDTFRVKDSAADIVDGGVGTDNAQVDLVDQLTGIETRT